MLAVGLGAILYGARTTRHEGCRSPADCITAAPRDAEFVSTRADHLADATLRMRGDGSVRLVTLRGRTRWRIATRSAVTPRLVAAGDIDDDGVTDYVLALARPLVPAARCGDRAMQVTSLLVVDGKTGPRSTPVALLPDICWKKPTFSYPTHQWGAGTAYIGDFTEAYSGPELILTPYYASTATVWNLAQTGRWQRVRAASSRDLAFPSMPQFDRVYDASNSTPCSQPVPGGPCFVPDSHVANAVMLPAEARGLFVLTRAR